jgi:phage tail-like protein
MQGDNDQLIIQFEGNIIQTFPLTQKAAIIGREPETAITLPHPLISRSHAEVRLAAQGMIITDLGSSNGTFIDTERLAPNQPRVLTDGMSFRIGPYQLTYRAARSSRTTQFPSEMIGEHDEQSQAPELAPSVTPVAEPVPQTTTSRPTTQQTQREVVHAPKSVAPGVPQSVKPPLRPLDPVNKSVYSNYLPGIYEENDFLQRFLYIFEDIWEPLEQRQDHIEMYFDPRTCPVAFLPWLASWLGISLNPHWPEARRRRLLAQAMDLYRWRGTRYGLVRMIEVCTGITPLISENPLEPFVFRIRVTLPANAVQNGIDRELLEELIHIHKPAHAGYILEVIS